jgi:ribonucleotide reductase beta subunit family protein with ferritin-like domain
MTETVFNTVAQNTKEHYMFFGEQPNIARYDQSVHPIFDKLATKQKGYFWQPEEFDLTKDRNDFKMLTDAQKHIWSKTLSYQIVLDTIQSRSPALALLPFCTLPELEACITAWTFFESIHNYAYSYILRNVYATPADLLDGIVLDESIIERAKGTIKYYDDFIDYANKYRGGAFTDHVDDATVLTNLKKKLILCVASINALEGLSFYASFACSFAFAEQGLMEGNAKEISVIAKDEALHLAITQNILKKWASGDDDPEMVALYAEALPQIEEIYINIIEQEKDWCRYLFRDGSMIGLNEKILSEYVEYIAGKRMKNIGIKTKYPTKNPLTWTEKYLTSADLQVSPQEVEQSSYIIGGIKNDIAYADFSNFKF